MADLWDSGGGGGSWSPTFTRALNDWEIEVMASFLQTLHDQIFRASGEDMLNLKEAKGKSFSVKVMYKGYDLSPTCDFPHRLIWNSVTPPKMGIFSWEAAWGKILTLDNLKRRGVAFANRCFMCEEEEETIDHLLIHCKSAKMLWDLFLTMVGISWVFPHSVLHTLLAWQGGAVGKKRRKIWIAAPSCIFWALWCARNKLVFENVAIKAQSIKINFISNLWAWANLFSNANSNSVIDFLTWLGCR